MDNLLQIRLLIVDDHLLFRKAILTPLNMDRRIDVVATAPDGEFALQMCRDPQFRPDVILVDLHMPHMNGLELLQQLQAIDNAPYSLLLTGDEAPGNVYQALTLGARGYLLKDNITEESIVAAVITVAEGMYCIDADIMAQQLETITPIRIQSNGNDDAVQQLTDAERDLLRAVALGHNNKQIAMRHDITTKTVSNRLNLIYNKIGVPNRVQAAFFALKHGIIQADEVL